MQINVINTLRPRLNRRHFADDIFKCIFLNENVWIPIKISMKFVPKGPINNIQALVQIMAWRCPGDKPLSEPMMVSLMTHICVTRPQWVNCLGPVWESENGDFWPWCHVASMLTSSNGNIFHVTGPLCGEFTSHWCRALMFSLICARINSEVNNCEAGDLRRHRTFNGVTVMSLGLSGAAYIS